MPISSLSKASSSLLGGIPWVCTGVVLTFKHNESDAPIKLQIQCPGLFSPLLRSGALKYIMEECNYASHSWSRPVHHPLILGPRILRVLGPRPQMRVTNLTGPLTDCKLVMGTVNRILFRLDAGKDEDCWDLRVKVKSTSSKKPRSPCPKALSSLCWRRCTVCSKSACRRCASAKSFPASEVSR